MLGLMVVPRKGFEELVSGRLHKKKVSRGRLLSHVEIGMNMAEMRWAQCMLLEKDMDISMYSPSKGIQIALLREFKNTNYVFP